MAIHILGTSHISPKSKEQVKKEAGAERLEDIFLKLEENVTTDKRG